MKRKTQTAVTNMKLNKRTAGIEFHSEHPVFLAPVRDGPLEKLWGEGGWAKYKKNSCKGKLSEKNSCMQSRPGKKFLHWPSTHFAQISGRQAGMHTMCKTSAL